MVADPDPVVRMMWGYRQTIIGMDDPTKTEAVRASLEKLGGSDADPIVRQYFNALAQDLKSSATQPAATSTAPAP